MTAPVQLLIDEGHAALRVGDAAGARRAFEQAAGEAPSGDVIEGLGSCRLPRARLLAAIEDWERAYALHRDTGDGLGAVRVARTLAYMYGSVVGDAAGDERLARRGRRRCWPESAESAEGGWVALNMGMFEGDRAAKEERFREALELARRFGDTDLEFVTLAYLGASLVHADRTEEGMVLLDEALAAVAGSEVDDFVRAAGDLLPALLGLRARPRRHAGRSVDPDR